MILDRLLLSKACPQAFDVFVCADTSDAYTQPNFIHQTNVPNSLQ